MTDAMKVQVAILSVVAIATVVIGHIVWNDVWPEQKTVEQEEDEAREVAGSIGQHHPTVNTSDHLSEDAEDPMSNVIDFLNEQRAATGL